jgi:outer membrane protein OmpA-like peptidoglycan-associated protein
MALAGVVLLAESAHIHGMQSAGGGQQPELAAVKVEFVPGEKQIFYDDFSDMQSGDAPSRFKVRGPAHELRVAEGIRQLTTSQTGSLYPNIAGLPKNFTYEAEVQFENPRNARTALILYSKGKEALIWWVCAAPKPSNQSLAVKSHTEQLARTNITTDWSQPAKLALWVQNGRIRAYVNGERYADANQVDLPPIDRVEILSYLNGTGQSLGYRSVRFAESTPDFSQVISAAGRYVSHGIHFDTGSDRLKPESAAVIQTVARGLSANPALKLLIEGHTDSAGDAALNLDLSRRRAEAVKNVLISQFKVDASRLTTAGLGASKPMDTNDTPAGRSQNRRVEFVKQ